MAAHLCTDSQAGCAVGRLVLRCPGLQLGVCCQVSELLCPRSVCKLGQLQPHGWHGTEAKLSCTARKRQAVCRERCCRLAAGAACCLVSRGCHHSGACGGEPQRQQHICTRNCLRVCRAARLERQPGIQLASRRAMQLLPG